MKTETNEKLLHLLSAITPENMKHLVNEIWDENISPQQFRENCHLATLSFDKRDEYERMKILDARYEGLKIYEDNMVCELYTKHYPDGMDFKVDGIGIQQIDDLIHKGHLLKGQSAISKVGDQTPSVNGLQCKFHLPVDKYQNLWVSSSVYEDENLADWLEYKGYNSDFNTAPTIALNQHPDGHDVSMFFYEDELLRLLQVEGQPLWKVIAIKLQIPGIDQEMMVRYLRNPHQFEDLMQLYKDAAQEKMKYHSVDGMNPDGFHMVKGKHFIFMFESHKMGYVHIDAYRVMQAYGETMSEANRQRIANLIENQHYILKDENGELNDFFLKNPKEMDKRCTLMHQKTGQCIDAQELVNYDGTLYYRIGNNIEDAQDWVDYINITDRITDINIITQGSLRIRCKIDGVQQSARFLNYPERLVYEYGFKDPQDEKDFLFRTAVKLFHEDLLNVGQQQSQGRKL